MVTYTARQYSMVTYTAEAILYGNLHSNTLWRQYSMVTYTGEAILYGNLHSEAILYGNLHSRGNTLW